MLLAFLAGTAAGSFFNISKNTILWITAICVALIAVFYRRHSRLLNPYIALASFLTVVFLAGVIRFNAVASRRHTLQKIAQAGTEVNDPFNKHPIKVTLYGYINDEPSIKGDKQRLTFYSKAIAFQGQTVPTEERVLLTVRLYPEYHYGQQIKVQGAPKIPQNSSDFDYRAYLAKEGIYTVIDQPEITETKFNFSFYEKIKTAVYRPIFQLKDAFVSSLYRSLTEPNASYAAGVLLGARSAQIPPEIINDFSRTSTSHILAVSGYNITIIAVVISWFFLRFMKRPTAFWFSLAGVAFFTILTGAQASVVRAAIMGSLLLVANRVGRLNDARNSVVLAGTVMVLLNPLILRHDVGFQLSFASTLGLIFVSPIIERYFTRLPAVYGLRDTLVATSSAQFFVLPLLIYYFHTISLVALPVNLLILPTIPWAMLLGFITGLAGMIWPFLGQLIGYFTWLLTAVELGIVHIFARPSWSAVTFNPTWYEILTAYALIIVGLVKLNKKSPKAK